MENATNGDGLSTFESTTNSAASTGRQIFVVHGHDSDSRDQLELVLRRLGLEPFILMNTSGGGLTIIEALEGKIGHDYSADFGIVLLTPDDMGYANKDGPEKAEPRARQNVILEIGMLLSSLTRSEWLWLLEVTWKFLPIFRESSDFLLMITSEKLCRNCANAFGNLGSTSMRDKSQTHQHSAAISTSPSSPVFHLKLFSFGFVEANFEWLSMELEEEERGAEQAVLLPCYKECSPSMGRQWQLTFSSHSTNVVVNGDANFVACCDYLTTGD